MFHLRIALILCFAVLPAAAGSLAAQDLPPLTLDSAIALATERSPELAGAAIEVRAREARIGQAGARPNPQLNTEVENIAGDATITGGRQSTFEVGQLVELGGKRGARVEAASASRDIARWDYESARRELVARVTRGFFEVLAAQRSLELSDEGVELSEEVARTVSALVEAGKVSPIEETRAQVALATERIERDRVRADLMSARSRLAATWGEPASAIGRVEGDLSIGRTIPPLETLIERAANNPVLERQAALIAEREAILRLAQARGTPDVTIAGGYRDFELGSEAYVASASIPLPLFDRNRGAQLEARERVALAQEERRAAELRVRQAVTQAHADLIRAGLEVRSIEEGVVPGAESVFAAISEGYRLGKFGYVDVLDARRTLASTRMQLARAQAELQRAFAEVERLTASPIDSMRDGNDDGNDVQ